MVVAAKDAFIMERHEALFEMANHEHPAAEI
jgi:hypothetical protein